MTDNKKDIEEITKVIVNFKEKHSIPLGVDFHSVDLSKDIIEAGYRKADEVKKETAREILEYLRAVQEKDELKNCDLAWIEMQYGVEVDE